MYRLSICTILGLFSLLIIYPSFRKKIHKFSVVEVAGGIKVYIKLFFSKNCIHTLSKRNDQFIDLL